MKCGEGVSLVLRETSVGIVATYAQLPSFLECCERASVRADSYAAELIQRIYDWYLEGLIDLKEDYLNYYRPEYPTIEAFLYHKYGFSSKEVGSLADDLSLDSIKVCLVLNTLGADGELKHFLEDFEGKTLAAEVLSAEWRSLK